MIRSLFEQVVIFVTDDWKKLTSLSSLGFELFASPLPSRLAVFAADCRHYYLYFNHRLIHNNRWFICFAFLILP